MENQNLDIEQNKPDILQSDIKGDQKDSIVDEGQVIENKIDQEKEEQLLEQKDQDEPSQESQESDSHQQAEIDLKKDENIQQLTDIFQEQIILLGIQSLVSAFNKLDKSEAAKAIELLKEIILLKKKLKLDCMNEFNCLLRYTMNLEQRQYAKLGLDVFYEIKAQLSPDDVEDTAHLYSFICTAEMILGNSDTAQFVIEEALAYIKEKGLDENGLQSSGLIRQRTKIYENRNQHKEYVDDHKLSISILENVDPHLKTDFHDKYIAQMIPQYIETEMEKLKFFDFDNQEKRLKQAYQIWKKREGENPVDFCNFKTTFLLLFLYSKFKQPNEYLELQREVENNNNILKRILFNSGQYLSIFTKSLFVLAEIKRSQNEAQKNQNENDEIKEKNEEPQQVFENQMENQLELGQCQKQSQNN